MPVPEIYGWQTDAGTGEVFLYMELVQGLTLESVWDTLSEEDRKSVCLQLGRCMANLRLLIQDAGDQFIGIVLAQICHEEFHH